MSKHQQSNPEPRRSMQELESLVSVAEFGGDVAEIDLHGMRADEAVLEADQAIHQMYVRGEGVLRVVHGRGAGVLRQKLHDLFKQHALVEYFRDGLQGHEIGGVTYVVLVLQ